MSREGASTPLCLVYWVSFGVARTIRRVEPHPAPARWLEGGNHSIVCEVKCIDQARKKMIAYVDRSACYGHAAQVRLARGVPWGGPAVLEQRRYPQEGLWQGVLTFDRSRADTGSDNLGFWFAVGQCDTFAGGCIVKVTYLAQKVRKWSAFLRSVLLARLRVVCKSTVGFKLYIFVYVLSERVC